MADRSMTEREQRVTPLELFFDLVFVYALTQVTQLMANDLTWLWVGHGLLVLAALWWAWTGYAWLTNILEPEEGVVRAGVFGAMIAMLVAAIAVPGAFGADAILFGTAFLVVRLLNLGLDAVAGRHDPGLRRALVRFAPPAALAPLVILLAGFFDGPAQVALWIVALGESIVSIGVGSRAEALTPGVVTAAVLWMVVLCALWWTYFDVIAVLSQRQLSEATGAARARLARDYYTYLHLPMITGIVLFALGLRITIDQVGKPLATIPAVALCGGLSLYFLTHVALRLRLVHFIRRSTPDRPGWIGPGRLATGIGMLALIPAALAVPALVALGLVAALCWALIAWDVLHYREHRSEVRRVRP